MVPANNSPIEKTYIDKVCVILLTIDVRCSLVAHHMHSRISSLEFRIFTKILTKKIPAENR